MSAAAESIVIGMTNDELADLGMDGIAAGIKVFVTQFKELPTHTEKSPTTPHGHHDATLDPAELYDQITSARRRYPNVPLGIGAVPGAAGYVAIDYDIKNGARGGEVLEQHRARYGEVVDRVSYTSISGAVNVLMRKPDTSIPIGNTSPWADVDIRSDSGWIVLPGNRCPWGSWEWRSGDFDDLADAVMPGEMFDLLKVAGDTESSPANRAESEAWLDAGKGPHDDFTEHDLREWVDTLAICGNRNPTLFEALSWMRRIDPGDVDRRAAFEAIDAAWKKRMTRDGEKGRMNEPWSMLGRVVGFAKATEEKQTVVDTDTGEIVKLPPAWVDAHVGEAFADALGDNWIYVGLWRRWMYWDGRRWIKDDTEAIHEEARQWIVRLGMAVMAKPGNNGDLLKSIASYKAAGKLEAVVKVARRIKAVDPAIFDTHAHLLNCHNGVVDMRTGELGVHDPTLYITMITGCDYVPHAHHPDVDAAVACMSPQVAASVQEHLGISASGHTGADHIGVFDGKGANGKTTLVEAASAALATYAGPIPNELVMQSRREDHPTVKMTLFGLRFAVIEETEEDGGLRLERLKAISGGGEITGRLIGGDYCTFSQTHTLTIATNHRPIVNSPEYAVWRRLRLVPFPYRYVHEPQRDTDRPIDPGLRQRLRSGAAQRRAMLAWIVAGAIRAYDGNDTPEVAWCDEIMEATNEWRLSEDVIGRFLADCVTFHPDVRTRGTDVFTAWEHWCEQENRPAGQAKNFHRKFQTHDDVTDHIEVIKPQGALTYIGVSASDPWGIR